MGPRVGFNEKGPPTHVVLLVFLYVGIAQVEDEMMIWSFLAPFQIGDCHRHYPRDGFNRLFTNS